MLRVTLVARAQKCLVSIWLISYRKLQVTSKFDVWTTFQRKKNTNFQVFFVGPLFWCHIKKRAHVKKQCYRSCDSAKLYFLSEDIHFETNWTKKINKITFFEVFGLGPVFSSNAKNRAQKMTTNIYFTFQSCTRSQIILLCWDIVFRVNWTKKINKINYFEVLWSWARSLIQNQKTGPKDYNRLLFLIPEFFSVGIFSELGYCFRTELDKNNNKINYFEVFRPWDRFFIQYQKPKNGPEKDNMLLFFFRMF